MGEMGTISEHELREGLWASGNGANTVHLATLADDALRQARRHQRIARTATTLSVALVVAAVGVTVSTVGTSSHRHVSVSATSTVAVRHAPVKLLTPIRFLLVKSVSAGACETGGITGLPGTGAAAGGSCFQVDSAHAMSISEVADIRVVPVSTTSTTQVSNQWEITVTFVDSDKEAFARLTSATVNRQLAVVINGEVVDAPLVMGPITTGAFALTGYSRQSADALVGQLTGHSPR